MSLGQLSINFDARHAARKSDPATSHIAARNAERFASSHAGRILDALVTYGPSTAYELSRITGLSVVQIDRRLPDLKKANLARVSQLDGADRIEHGFRVWGANA